MNIEDRAFGNGVVVSRSGGLEHPSVSSANELKVIISLVQIL